MKAVVYEEYGSPDVLQLKEIDKPVPKDNEVLIKVHSVSLNSLDWRILRANPFLVRFMGFGLLKPSVNILGADISGTIESIGKNIKQFQVGDEVLGDKVPGKLGGLAEYTCATEDVIIKKPRQLSFDDCACLPIARVTVLQGLRDYGKIQSGQRVLIHGASGGVGTFAVQIAKYFGADVTGQCSTGNIDMVQSLGADQVIDYKKEDFVKLGQKYDLIFAANGGRSIFEYKQAMNPHGIYVMVGGSGKQMFQAMALGPILSIFSNQRFRHVIAKTNLKDMSFLIDILESGHLKPLIDRKYSLDETADAFRYIETGHASGKVIIHVNQ